MKRQGRPVTGRLLRSAKPRVLAACMALIACAATTWSTEAVGSGDVRLTVPTGVVSKGLNTPVTLDADDAYLPKVLAALAERSGYNVVAGPEVNNQQRISIHLKETPVEEAINLVVRAAGLSYEIVGSSFLVTGHENLKKEVGQTPHLIELQYARASEVKALFKDLSATVQVDTAHNALLLSASPKTLAEVRKIVAIIDKPSRQLMLQTRVIEVSVEEAEKAGVDWEKLSKLTTILAENPFDPALGGVTPDEGMLGQTKLGELPEKHVFQKIDGFNNVGYMSRQLTAFNVTLDWLLRNNLATVLNNTKLTTMNNRTATIFVGDVIPFLVQSQQTAQVEREEIGIKVEITPQINDEGVITAQVRPEVSTIFELIDGRIPHKKIRTASTTVQVRDQQKIYLAGLLKDEETTVTHKLPFLGDLLFVGSFFSHKDRMRKKTDLVIEITPYILNNSQDLERVMSDTLFRKPDSLTPPSKDKFRDGPAAGPTHLAFLPSDEVLKPWQYLVSAREISLGQQAGLQVTFSPWQHVGHIRLGIKRRLAEGTALGLGWSHGTQANESRYDLGNRLGLFLAQRLWDVGWSQGYGEFDLQVAKHSSFGAGAALRFFPASLASVIFEVSNNYTPQTPGGRTEYWDPWGSALLRLRWPWLPRLGFDLGVTYRPKTWLNKPFGPADPDLTLSDNLRPYRPALHVDLFYGGVL